jgi:hypothetical protein
VSTAEVPLLKEKLLEDWEKIFAVVTLASGESNLSLGLAQLALSSPLAETQLQIARRWVSIFSEEIAAVQLVRNAVAHAQPITEESLRESVKLAEELLATLSQRLNGSTDASVTAS